VTVSVRPPRNHHRPSDGCRTRIWFNRRPRHVGTEPRTASSRVRGRRYPPDHRRICPCPLRDL